MADIHRHCPHCGHRLGIDGWATMDQGSNGYRYGGQIECCRRVPAAWRKPNERNHMKIVFNDSSNPNEREINVDLTADQESKVREHIFANCAARNDQSHTHTATMDGLEVGRVENTHTEMSDDLAHQTEAFIDGLLGRNALIAEAKGPQPSPFVPPFDIITKVTQ